MHCEHGITTGDTCNRCAEKQKRESGCASVNGSGYIMRANLMRALRVAIDANQRDGCGFNCETLGWQQVLNDLNNGRTVEVRE